jgi:hypothetical protein
VVLRIPIIFVETLNKNKMTTFQKDQINIATFVCRNICSNPYYLEKIIKEELIDKKIFFDMDKVEDIEMVKTLVQNYINEKFHN